jgi:DtxR family Mn-dependent transcriptional regulator
VKSERIEEYLEALFKLTENGKPAKTNEIASALDLSPSSVTEMLQKLKKMRYVKYKPYRGATLTRKGMRKASKIVRRHRILERFLHDELKIKKDDVHDPACEMEHTISDEVEEALCRMLEHPEACPDDERPIPICDKDVESCAECIEKEGSPSRTRKKQLVSLARLKSGDTGVVKFLRGGRGLVRRLADMGLTKDTKITVNKSAPFSGPVEVRVRGTNLALGRGVAAKIFVLKG